MSRRRKALYLFLGLAVILGLLAAKMIVQVRRGEDIFWLGELWAPAAVLSIGVVTGIEFLMAPARPSHAPAEPVPVEAAPAAAEPPKLVRARKAPAKTASKPKTKKSPKK